MSPKRLEFHPQAIAEARAARRRYAEENPAVARRFAVELDDAVAQISAATEQWPVYLHETRVYRLPRFPYLVIYRETLEAIQVVAVAHGMRRPGYWRRRSF